VDSLCEAIFDLFDTLERFAAAIGEMGRSAALRKHALETCGKSSVTFVPAELRA
jgi:hypothetical protein